MFRSSLLAASLVAASSFVGCGPGEKAPFGRADVEPYAELKQLQTTQHARLRDELARIELAGATPLLLEKGTSSDHDLGQRLLAVLPREKHKGLAGEIDRLWPSGRFTMSPHQRQQTGETLARQRELLLATRELLKSPDDAFRYPFRQGLFAEAPSFEGARLAARLEGLAAAEALLRIDEPRFGEAIASLDRILEWSARLGQVKHPIARLLAADVRSDGLSILAAITGDARATTDDLLKINSLVERELKRWSPDADAWIGERAIALHTYEMIRDGHLLSFLSVDEISQARKKGSIHALGESVALNLQHDEYFYLSEMHEIISACRLPFHERAAALRELERKVRSLEGTPEYPYVAAKILLPRLPAGHRRQGEDLANWLTWSVAFQAALGTPGTTDILDPISGEPYVIALEDTRVVVRRPGKDGESHRVAIVPILSGRSVESTARRP